MNGTRALAVEANTARISTGFGTVTAEMSHLQTIPTLDILWIARFLYPSQNTCKPKGSLEIRKTREMELG